jgi:hypothetical protein
MTSLAAKKIQTESNDQEDDLDRTTDKWLPRSSALVKRSYDGLNIKGPLSTTSGPEPTNETVPDWDDSVPVLADPIPLNLTEMLTKQSNHIASFRMLQEWDGYILSIGSDAFVARLTDLTSKGQQDAQQVEIRFEELDDDSKARLAVGRYFRWAIGYERSRSGQKTRVSRIAIRQLPAWTASQLAQAEKEAARLSRELQWD